MLNDIVVPYTEVSSALGEITPRPILTVEITYQGTALSVAGLVDSGADVNVLPYGVGTALGLDWDEQRFRLQLTGNLANFDTRAVVLEVRVADLAPVGLAVAWTRAEQAPLIFGQTNFFQAFNVCFFRSEAYFTLTPKDIAEDK